MKNLISNSQFVSPQIGTKQSGDKFQCTDELANKLIKAGLAKEYKPEAAKTSGSKKTGSKKSTTKK